MTESGHGRTVMRSVGMSTVTVMAEPPGSLDVFHAFSRNGSPLSRAWRLPAPARARRTSMVARWVGLGTAVDEVVADGAHPPAFAPARARCRRRHGASLVGPGLA